MTDTPRPPEGAIEHLCDRWDAFCTERAQGRGVDALDKWMTQAVLADQARSELAALRRRAEDLEMMLRVCLPSVCISRTIHTQPVLGHKPVSWVLRFLGQNRKYPLADDGTGLPVLDDAAREAIRRAT